MSVHFSRAKVRIAIRTLSVLIAACHVGMVVPRDRAFAIDEAPAPQPRDLFLADPQLRFYWPKQQVCGIVAVYVALQDFGCGRDLHSLSAAMPLTPDGTSMAKCSDILRTNGLSTVCIDASEFALEEALRGNRGLRAIALVNGKHWVYVSGVQSKELMVYDYPRWRPLREQSSDMKYSGKCIIVGKDYDVQQFKACGRYYNVFALLCVAANLALVLLAIPWLLARPRSNAYRMPVQPLSAC